MNSDKFWSTVLQARKVKRVLEKNGCKPEVFQRDYEDDHQREHTPKKPSQKQVDAVEAFQVSGDLEALKHTLLTKSTPVANGIIRRVIQFEVGRK